MAASARSVIRIRSVGWSGPERWLPMPDASEDYAGIRVSDRCLWRGDSPWVPVTGEMHYSRVPPHRWEDALRLMKAGGISVVATYVFWIHHQPVEHQQPRFDGVLDVAEFVRLAADVGLDVVLRIGPWCHGEVRNGGHPDWVAAASYAARTDDPDYLRAVARWFDALGRQLRGWCGPGGPVVGIQLENELYDRPQHILTLKDLARRAGLRAPLWLATAWGGADLPVGEVFPMYGGYADGFWVDAHDGWHDSFRDQFTFSHRWDDPGIGADLAGDRPVARTGPPPHHFPPATCELGGGMASAYHRRIAVAGQDVAAVAHCKLGSGSVWQGYYMFVGGTNPGPSLHESQDTGYPNDLPELDYDFGAPIGAHLQLRESYHRLRGQHTFLATFGQRLARMTSVLPEHEDDLRWALRTDGRGGFLFLSTHRPYEPLPAAEELSFEVELEGIALRMPHEPVDIPSGEILAWPLMLDVGGITLRWATATVLTVVDVPGDLPVLVLVATKGVPVHLAVPADHTIHAPDVLDAGDERVLAHLTPSRSTVEIDGPGGGARVLVLPAELGLQAWTPAVEGFRRLVLSPAAVLPDRQGLAVVASSACEVLVLPALGSGDADGFSHHPVPHDVPDVRVDIEQLAPAGEPAARPCRVPDRAPAPDDAEFERCAARYRITVTGPSTPRERALLRLHLVGDAARSTFAGRRQDVFWNGTCWDIDITPAQDLDRRVVEVSIYPLAPTTAVRLPEPAERLRAGAAGPVARIDSAEVLTFRITTIDHQRNQPR